MSIIFSYIVTFCLYVWGAAMSIMALYMSVLLMGCMVELTHDYYKDYKKKRNLINE